MNITSRSEAVLARVSRKSSAFSDHAWDTIKFTSKGSPPFTSNAYPRPVPAVHGLMTFATMA